MRKIELSLETATRWYNGTDAELKGLALQTYPELGKKELPNSWGALEKVSGHYYYTFDKEGIRECIDCSAKKEENKIIFATHEQAEASIALAQLSQLMKVYNDGWVADWKNDEEIKYSIEFYKEKIHKNYFYTSRQFLAFKDAETRDLFLRNFEDLILTAKPLL